MAPARHGRLCGGIAGIAVCLTVAGARGAIQTGPITTIDFEDVTTSGLGQGGQVVLTAQYAARGVTFNRAFVLDYSKGQAVEGFAHSGTRAIEQCYGMQFCTSPIEAQFRIPQTRVKVWVGYSLPRHGAGSIMLVGQDASGAAIVRKSVEVPASLEPTAIRHSLEIAVAEPRIQRISVIALAQLGPRGLAVDDLEFETTSVRPPPSPTVEKPAGKPPVALSLTLVSPPVVAGEAATFAVSVDTAGQVPRFLFNAGDGSERQTVETAVFTHTYATPATGVTATVVPADAPGPDASVTFDVAAPPPPPIALNLAVVSTDIAIGKAVSFVVPLKGGGALPAYLLNIGDGSPGQTRSEPTFSHVFQKAGRFAVSVRPPPGVAGTGSTVVVTVPAPIPIWIYGLVVVAAAAVAYGVWFLLRLRRRPHAPTVVTLHARQRMPPQFTPAQPPRPASAKARALPADPAATLRTVFDDLKTDSFRVTLADDATVAPAVSAHLPGIEWSATAAELLPRVAELLDVELSRVLAVFWPTAGEIAPALEESRKSPGAAIEASLPDCSTTATLEPVIEIRFGGAAPPKRIPIAITLPLTFKGVKLTIRGGAIAGIASGECQLEGEVELGAVTIAKLHEPVTIALAGWPVPLDL